MQLRPWELQQTIETWSLRARDMSQDQIIHTWVENKQKVHTHRLYNNVVIGISIISKYFFIWLIKEYICIFKNI